MTLIPPESSLLIYADLTRLYGQPGLTALFKRLLPGELEKTLALFADCPSFYLFRNPQGEEAVVFALRNGTGPIQLQRQFLKRKKGYVAEKWQGIDIYLATPPGSSSNRSYLAFLGGEWGVFSGARDLVRKVVQQFKLEEKKGASSLLTGWSSPLRSLPEKVDMVVVSRITPDILRLFGVGRRDPTFFGLTGLMGHAVIKPGLDARLVLSFGQQEGRAVFQRKLTARVKEIGEFPLLRFGFYRELMSSLLIAGLKDQLQIELKLNPRQTRLFFSLLKDLSTLQTP